MCLNPHDPQTMRIFSTDGAFHTLPANMGGGMARHGVLQTCGSLCFMENVRCEMRPISHHGQVAGALPAQPGGKQINIIVQEVNPS